MMEKKHKVVEEKLNKTVTKAKEKDIAPKEPVKQQSPSYKKEKLTGEVNKVNFFKSYEQIFDKLSKINNKSFNINN